MENEQLNLLLFLQILSYYILFTHAGLPIWLKREKVVVKWLNSHPEKCHNRLVSLFKHTLKLFWADIHAAVKINKTKSGAASSLTAWNWAGFESSQLISSQSVWKSWRWIGLEHCFLLLICFEAAVHWSWCDHLSVACWSQWSLGASAAALLPSSKESDNMNSSKVVVNYSFCYWILERMAVQV